MTIFGLFLLFFLVAIVDFFEAKIVEVKYVTYKNTKPNIKIK